MKDKNSTDQQKNILILAVNPIGTTDLRLDEEVRDIQEGLQRSKYRDQFKVNQKWALQKRDLRRAILDNEPQILHFTGHGELEGILVEDEQGFATIVPPTALTELFKLASDRIECVILSACYSEKQAKAINQHIKYVIGMPNEINEKAAIEFAVGFYDALGAGKTVKESYNYGCNAIQQVCPNLSEFLYPSLHVNPGIRIKKKRKYFPPLFISLFLVAAFWLGLEWQSTQDGRKTTYTPAKKAVTTDTASPDRNVSRPETNPDYQKQIPDDDTWVYITKTGRKYHRGYCRYLKKSKIPIRLGKAKAEGYTPCSGCKPPG
jgi:hypothetical protein